MRRQNFEVVINFTLAKTPRKGHEIVFLGKGQIDTIFLSLLRLFGSTGFFM